MANKTVEVSGIIASGISGALLKLTAYGADTLLNTGGDTLTEATNVKGTYTCTVTEALAGWYKASVFLSDGTTYLGGGAVFLVDAVGSYPVVEYVPRVTLVDTTTDVTNGAAGGATQASVDKVLKVVQANANK